MSAAPVVRIARVEAQAKLNLFLRVLAREASGYHQIETLFQRIALADSVSVTVGGSGRSVDSTGADTGPAEKNLAWRAALAYAEATGGPAAFRIEIVKRIPVGGGLGGGSADAAAVLRALNALAARPVDARALGAIAFSLGADVPYLVSTHALAIGTGRGERLFALRTMPVRDVVLAVPPFGVSSADAFGWFAAEKAAHRSGTAATLPVGRQLQWKTIAALAANDLEGVVSARHPQISALKQTLRSAGAVLAQMSGSGSTVFGIFDSAPATAALDAIGQSGARVVMSSAVDRVADVQLG